MKSSPETRYTLIEKIKNPQDAEAWSEFTTIYQPLIFRLCRAKGMQHADATDVTQEVLARIAGAIGKFRYDHQGATFRGWLYRITRNSVIDFIRKREKNVLVQMTESLQLSFDVDPTQEESLEFQLEFQRQIFYLVAKKVQCQVKPDTWDAFWQTEMEQRPVVDVAKELGMSTGAVYVARSRTIARLKQEVDKRLSETGQSSFQ